MLKRINLFMLVFTLSPMLHAGPLHDACRDGDLQKVQVLLGKATSDDLYELEAFDSFEAAKAPIHIAIEFGHLECVKAFLAIEDFNVEVRTAEGATALHTACSLGKEEIAKLLMASGADVNSVHLLDLTTPLIEACCGGKLRYEDFDNPGEDVYLNIVELLLEKGALVDTMPSNEKFNGSIIETMLQQGVIKDTTHLLLPLAHAKEHNNLKIVERLIKNGAESATSTSSSAD